jgi:hypothetical protein
MPRTAAEGLAYVDEAEFMIRHQYGALAHYYAALDEIRDDILKISRAREVLSDIFINEEQWSVAANAKYALFVQRMETLNTREQEMNGDAAVPNLLARSGATVESIELVAGAVLQIGKQALAYRFGGKGQVPRAGRLVGTQPAVEVIWEGRNHALHWEDSNPRDALVDMLAALVADLGTTIRAGENNSRAILEALGWRTPDDVLTDLRVLVR